MKKHETSRQQKLNSFLQQEIAKLLQKAVREGSVNNLLVSVTKVNVTSDFSIAKIYLSIFPSNNTKSYLKALQKNSYQIRYDLAKKMKNHMRKIPNLHFYLDDSLDYIEDINKGLNHGENPLINVNTLTSRQKK